MLLRNTTILVFLFFFLTSFNTNVVSKKTEGKDARLIVDELFESIDKVKTLKYNLKCMERINGKLHPTESVVKYQRSPRKLYLYLKGPELLWVQGENNANALVNPGAFPYFNLNLDPFGSILRKDLHHTIHEIGFDYLAGILQHSIKEIGNKFDQYFFYTGDEKWNDRLCYKITIINHDFSYLPYTVKKGENLISIASKLKVSEYMILENNPGIKDYYSVKEGQQIKVPSAYAKQTILYIDKQYMLPIKNMVSDEKGLFESYEYHNLQLNPKIADEEFTRNYKDYKF